MALLVRERDGEQFLLGDLTLIGRDASCDLRLRDPRVSQLHARLVCQKDGWSLEDLGSRNGLSLNGRPVLPNTPRSLKVNDVLVVGTQDEAWRVMRLGSAGLFARASSGETLTGTDYLCLPAGSAPEATIYQQSTGRWVVERPDSIQRIDNRDVVVVCGQTWRLFIPGTDLQTQEARDRALGIDGIALSFAVSSDEENVRVTLQGDRHQIDLKVRSHHYLLLTLARARVADQQQDGLSPSEHGWLYQDKLCQMLALDSSAIYLQIHRARRQLEAAGIARSADIVERRPGSGQLRIGVAALEVRRA
jgi:hypothetical protein